MRSTLIVTADDFGLAPGVTAGIVEAHARGIVTSTSLMVRSPHAAAAVAAAAGHPALALGLHLDLSSPFAAAVDRGDPVAVRRELEAQAEAFAAMAGRGPTHLDGHHHVHLEPAVEPQALELAELLRVHLRHHGPARFIGAFDARPEPGAPADRGLVSRPALLTILDGLGPGVSELMCHPGHPAEAPTSYAEAREWELATLTGPGLRGELEARGIRLASFADFS